MYENSISMKFFCYNKKKIAIRGLHLLVLDKLNNIA